VPSSSLSSTAFDEEWASSTGPNTIHFAVDTALWHTERTVVHAFRGGPRGQKGNEATHIITVSLLNVFLLYFADIITLLVMETNICYHGHLERIDDGPSALPYVTAAEMRVFLAITIQIGN